MPGRKASAAAPRLIDRPTRAGYGEAMKQSTPKHVVSLNNIPPEGKSWDILDAAVWEAGLAEFAMDVRISSPVAAHIHILPTGVGYLVRGRITGGLVMPCNRCAEDAAVELDADFESFEALPDAAPAVGDDDDDADGQDDFFSDDVADSRIIMDGGSPTLDLAAVAWEEFVLALPVNPLCRPDCKGLCPSCGVNRNTGSCTCQQEQGDPRLAAIKNFKVKKSS